MQFIGDIMTLTQNPEKLSSLRKDVLIGTGTTLAKGAGFTAIVGSVLYGVSKLTNSRTKEEQSLDAHSSACNNQCMQELLQEMLIIDSCTTDTNNPEVLAAMHNAALRIGNLNKIYSDSNRAGAYRPDLIRKAIVANRKAGVAIRKFMRTAGHIFVKEDGAAGITRTLEPGRLLGADDTALKALREEAVRSRKMPLAFEARRKYAELTKLLDGVVTDTVMAVSDAHTHSEYYTFGTATRTDFLNRNFSCFGEERPSKVVNKLWCHRQMEQLEKELDPEL